MSSMIEEAINNFGGQTSVGAQSGKFIFTSQTWFHIIIVFIILLYARSFVIFLLKNLWNGLKNGLIYLFKYLRIIAETSGKSLLNNPATIILILLFLVFFILIVLPEILILFGIHWGPLNFGPNNWGIHGFFKQLPLDTIIISCIGLFTLFAFGFLSFAKKLTEMSVFIILSIVFVALALFVFIRNPYNILNDDTLKNLATDSKKLGKDIIDAGVDSSSIAKMLTATGLGIILLSFIFLRRRQTLYGEEKGPSLFKFAGLLLLLLLSIILVAVLFLFSVDYVGSNVTIASFVSGTLLTFTIIGLITFGVLNGFDLIMNFINKISPGEYSFLNLLFKVILYIPCLIIDGIKWVKKEYNISTNSNWILLGVELVFLFLYLFWNKLIGLIAIKDGKLLTKNPPVLNLNKKTNLGTYEFLNETDNKKGYRAEVINKEEGATLTDGASLSFKRKIDANFTYNYAISGWFNIKNMPPNTNKAYTKWTNVLNYGNKPAIQYKADENKLKVMMQTGSSSSKEITIIEDIPLQKWNHIVINNNNGTLDTFFNNKLVSSVDGEVPYIDNESVIIGEDNGIYGSVINVLYYDKPLSIQKIDTLYNSFKNP